MSCCGLCCAQVVQFIGSLSLGFFCPLSVGSVTRFAVRLYVNNVALFLCRLLHAKRIMRVDTYIRTHAPTQQSHVHTHVYAHTQTDTHMNTHSFIKRHGKVVFVYFSQVDASGFIETRLSVLWVMNQTYSIVLCFMLFLAHK